MEFSETAKKITENLLHGDIEEICKSQNMSRSTFIRAMKRKNWKELTHGEEQLINAAVQKIKQRNRERQEAQAL